MIKAEEAVKNSFKAFEEKITKNGIIKLLEEKINEAILENQFSCLVELSNPMKYEVLELKDYLEYLGYEVIVHEPEYRSYLQGPGPIITRGTTLEISW